MNSYQLFFYWICIILIVLYIFHWGTYLTKNKYIVECFTGNRDEAVNPLQYQYQEQNGVVGDKGYIVNMPINTTSSCKNMCGPLNRCSITGENCRSDVDCFGCKPLISGHTNIKSKNVPGDNDAGKMTGGYTPTYSVLTTDIGTAAAPYKRDGYDSSRAPNYAKGVNTWFSLFQQGQTLFKTRYEPNGLKYELSYPPQYTLSGEFIDNGPLSSNI
jgi:hypothetical protein